MTGSETMTKRRRRSFSPEFKAEVVELCRQPGRNPGSVAAELDLTETAVRRWVNQADVDAGDRPGMSSARARGAGPGCAGRTGRCARSATS